MNRRVVYFLLAWVLTTAFCIQFVDRAASTWSHAHLHGDIWFGRLTHLVDPLAPAATLGFGIAILARLGWRWNPGRWGQTFVSACIAILVAFTMKEMLKYAFGRTWPETWVAHNPSWITNGAFGFHIYHGGEGWSSFPSGHTTQMAALAGVLWMRVRALRWLAVALLAAVMIGLWGADFHWVGDMAAGAFLGVASAAGVLAYLPPWTANRSD